MTTTSARREQILTSLQDKEYRDLFVAEEIDTGLPLQIRALRKARGWSQADLARRTGMTQEGISRLESLDYGRYTLATLKRLAAAFDIALVVRFEPFSRLVDWAANLSSEDMAVPDFGHDPGLVPATVRFEGARTADIMPLPRREEVGRNVRYLQDWETPHSQGLVMDSTAINRTSFAAAD